MRVMTAPDRLTRSTTVTNTRIRSRGAGVSRTVTGISEVEDAVERGEVLVQPARPNAAKPSEGSS